MRWLHRFLHHGQQLLAQMVQVNLVAQRCAESGQNLGGVILAAIEALVNDRLDTLAQGLSDEKATRVERTMATLLSWLMMPRSSAERPITRLT